MLTGDAPPAAEAAARQAGLEEFAAGLFPADKTARIRALQEEGYRVAMVGDGINDAPALAAAHVGIAIGHGSGGGRPEQTIAVKAADVVLVAGDLGRLPEAIVIGRRALSTVRRSILWFAVGLNGLSVLASASGFLAWLGYRLQDLLPNLLGSGRDISPVLAAVEHQIASLLVVTNSLRLLGGGPAWKSGQPAERAPADRELSAARFARALAASPIVLAAAEVALRLAAAAREALRRHRRPVCAGVTLALASVWLLSGVISIRPGQVGVVQRFGRLVAPALPPGLHYRLPWPVELVTQVDVGRVRRAEIGFRTSGAALAGASEWNTQHTGAVQRVADEALLLTGDEYLVDVNLAVQYRVRDAARFLFGSADAESTLRQAAETALRRAAGRTPLAALLTTGRATLEAQIAGETQSACDRFRTGLEVIGARLQEVHPPQEVVAAYRDVSSAAEEKATAVNQAEAYRNEAVPLARGQAAGDVASAAGYTVDRIRRAAGDGGRFSLSANGYRRGPAVNAQRLYLEAVEQALAGPGKYVMDPRGGGRRQMWLSDGQFPGLPGLPAPGAAPGSAPAMPPSEEEGNGE
jgi:HflK protein